MSMEGGSNIVDPSPKEVRQALKEIKQATKEFEQEEINNALKSIEEATKKIEQKEKNFSAQPNPNPISFWEKSLAGAFSAKEKLKDNVVIENHSSLAISKETLARIILEVKSIMQEDSFCKEFASFFDDLRNVSYIKIDNNDDGLNFELHVKKRGFWKTTNKVIFKVNSTGKIALP